MVADGAREGDSRTSGTILRTRFGEVEGVLEPSDGCLTWLLTLPLLWLVLVDTRWWCCRGIDMPGPELSDGVGGSPLLHAIEQ